jgi:pantoate--beta-alanine ligase
MELLRTVAEVRSALARAPRPVGFVPTMGAFHAGHVSLFEAARRESSTVVVSLFVNPAQFGERKDLEHYPRDEARDAAMAADAGVDVLFAPGPKEMYPDGSGPRWKARRVRATSAASPRSA